MADDLPHPARKPADTLKLDEDLALAVKRFHRLRWALVVVVSALLLLATAAVGVVLYRQSSQLTASCALYRDLGTLSIRPVPPLKRASKLSVIIVNDARQAYEGQCPGHIGPPSPSLLYWGRHYGIRIH